MAARLDRARLRHAGFLAETGQGVVFAEEGNDWAALAGFAHQGGRDISDILGDAETLMAQLGQMFGRRARLGVAYFRHPPDRVAQGDETRLDRVNATPNVTAVIHLAVLDPKVDVSL